MASNVITLADEDGDYPDWIELHNTGGEPVDLGGYALSDDPDDPRQWVFPQTTLPSGSRLLVFASGKDRVGTSLHTSFKLSSGGETVVLTDPEGVVVETVTYGALPADISYGKSPSAPTAWRYFGEPSPGQPNGSGYSGIATQPQLGTTGGRFSGPVSVAADQPHPEAVLRYTLDGSEPTPQDAELVWPLTVSSTGVLRVRAFRPDHLPSSTVTATYLVDEPTRLPAFALAVDPGRLWDPERGIYHPSNLYEEIEAPAHLALLPADQNQPALELDAGVRLFGGHSRRFAQKSLALFARGRYGADAFDHVLFPDLPYDEYQAFVLRNSGNDWHSTMMRDGLMQSLVVDTEVDGLEYRPAVMYLNGQYWGIHNLREKANEHYIARRHNVDPDEIDLLEFVLNNPNVQAIHGDAVDWNELIDYVESRDMNTAEALAWVEERVDLENFIDYQAAEIYFGNIDWPGNNTKFWRPRTANGRWRWILFDTDFGFGPDATHPTLNYATDPNSQDPQGLASSTVLIRQLLENEAFRRRFINRFADYRNTTLTPDRVIGMIDSLAARIDGEIPRHHARWPESVEDWAAEVDHLRTFARDRHAFFPQHMQLYFGLDEMAPLTVQTNGEGHVRVNRAEPMSFPWTGSYFAGVPVPLEAVPAPGWRFAGWSDGYVEGTRLVDPADAPTFTARFERGASGQETVVINEIQYNAPDDFETEDWIELFNPATDAVDLSGWVFSDGDDTHRFVIPEGTSLAPDGYLVLCDDAMAFDAAYPNADSCLGDWGFGLSGGGEQVRLFDAAGALVDQLEYDDKSPWPTEADGDGATLELVAADRDNALAENWRASGMTGGTPGALNSVTVDNASPPTTTALRLEPGFPNPFRHSVTFRYSIPEAGAVSLSVYDALGREVARLTEGNRGAGSHKVTFEPRGLSGGIYFVRLDAAEGTRTQRLTFVR